MVGKKDEHMSNSKQMTGLAILAGVFFIPSLYAQTSPEFIMLPSNPLEQTNTIPAVTPTPKISKSQQLLTQYYQVSKTSPKKAKQILQQILEEDPDNITALKEMGYLYLRQGNKKSALNYFVRAEQINPADEFNRLQIAYLLNMLGRNKAAYQQFLKLKNSTNPAIRSKARQALINLSGMQTKILPAPFFADLYFSPYYMSRFHNAIFPLIARAGMTFGPNQQGQVYTFVRATRDTRSANGRLPSIYADDSVVVGVGTRYQPLKALPIFAYMEIGEAYQFVKLNNRTWDSDFRIGAFGYDNWGALPQYAENLSFPLKQTGQVYGDVAYYTRYQNDTIATLSVRQGVRAAEYHYSAMNAYLRARVYLDTKGYFYNNLIEFGPGVSFTPDQRWNATVRLEALHGYYFPVNGPMVNPYGSNYNDIQVQFETGLAI